MSANPSPAIAAFLSFIFPGLGQIYAGEVRKGVLWAIPMLVFVLAALWAIAAKGALLGLVGSDRSVLALLVFNVAFFFYHMAAMIDAYAVAQRTRYHGFGSNFSGVAPIVLAALVSLTLVIHGVPEAYGVDVRNFLVANAPGRSFIPTFNPGTPGPTGTPGVATPTPSLLPTATPTSSSSGPPGSGNPTPVPTPRACPAIDVSGWAMGADGRLNLLLVGSDSRSDTGVSDNSLRTDSMILLSIDIASCKAALFSFPRNMCTVAIEGSCGPVGTGTRYPDWFQVPLEDGSAYKGFLFGLWRDAAASPQAYPGSDGIGSECQTQFSCERGWRALTVAVQQMAGVQVDGLIAVNLKGFVALVENLPAGGIWLDIPEALQDDAYYNSQQQLMKVDLKPGCQFLNPEETLAYARSRHQDSDYQRERRQQFVLQQIRKQLDPIGLLPHIPGLLQVAQENLFMTVAQQDIPLLAQVASRIDADRLYQYDFAPAHLATLGSMQGMRDKVSNIFSEPEPDPTTKPGQGPCPPRN